MNKLLEAYRDAIINGLRTGKYSAEAERCVHCGGTVDTANGHCRDCKREA